MVEILRNIPNHEIVDIDLPKEFTEKNRSGYLATIEHLTDPNTETFEVFLDKIDFGNIIHIWKGHRNGWSLLFGEETFLPFCAKKTLEINFEWSPNSKQLEWDHQDYKEIFSAFQNHLREKMKPLFKKYQPNEARKFPLVGIGRKIDGPYMLVDGVNRAQIIYMKEFLLQKFEFTPIKCIVGISKNSQKKFFKLVDALKQ